jgi:hypothetical protein
MDRTAEWILLWYGEIEWHKYYGMQIAFPHPRGIAQFWRNQKRIEPSAPEKPFVPFTAGESRAEHDEVCSAKWMIGPWEVGP